MNRPDDVPDPAELARQIAAMKASLPPGAEIVVFVILDQGSNYESGVVASTLPSVFAPVLRDWLKRYDAGEATPEQVQ